PPPSTLPSRGIGVMSQSDAWCMIRRRAKAAGIAAEIGCHTFRATGITAYLANGGALEHAQEMAAHESPRTTKLYDRTKEERLTQDEVERDQAVRPEPPRQLGLRRGWLFPAAFREVAAKLPTSVFFGVDLSA